MPVNQLEQQLCVELKKAESLYRRALGLIQSAVPTGEGQFDQISSCLVQLQPFMKQIEESESVLGPLKQHWMSFKVKAGAELKFALQVHQGLLGDLITLINKMEASTQQQRLAAIPQLDSAMRRQQMQRAYQQSNRQ
ncbi:hypothetical protein SH668x_000820 [Planctomicrobium sp. SH668]|uniref:hypothetical protein n=1 Tax=Planctomicrobium sp. SH668 TaxID=3448126 RepID=UPI003F5C4284